MWRRSYLLITVAALGASDPAHARGDPRLELQLAFGVSGSTELRTVMMTSPLFTLSAPVSGSSAFVARWGFTVATGEPTDSAFDPTYVAPGNLLLGWSLLLSEGLVFTPSLALPLARRPNADKRRPAADFALRGGVGLRGAVDPWLWTPDQLSLVLPLSHVLWLDPILIESHLKLGVHVATRGEDTDSDFVLQAQLRIAAHLGNSVWLAAGASGVYTPTETNDDAFQAAVSPELRYVFGGGSHLALTLMMNIDSPFGPFSEPGRFWGVHISGSTPL